MVQFLDSRDSQDLYKFPKTNRQKLIRKYQNNTFINYTNMDYLPILAMQIQEKHAQLQPQDKFCTCSRKQFDYYHSFSENFQF